MGRRDRHAGPRPRRPRRRARRRARSPRGSSPAPSGLLIALNSGLPGMCTLHANSAREAVVKMCTLPLLVGDNIGHAFVVPTVAASVDLVVHVATESSGQRRSARGRRGARAGRGRRRRVGRRLHPGVVGALKTSEFGFFEKVVAWAPPRALTALKDDWRTATARCARTPLSTGPQRFHNLARHDPRAVSSRYTGLEEGLKRSEDEWRASRSEPMVSGVRATATPPVGNTPGTLAARSTPNAGLTASRPPSRRAVTSTRGLDGSP
jgi:hypothetical protein